MPSPTTTAKCLPTPLKELGSLSSKPAVIQPSPPNPPANTLNSELLNLISIPSCPTRSLPEAFFLITGNNSSLLA